MSKHVQLLGFTSELTLTYVGFDRELVVDDGNRELRLHDGVTPGGKRFMNVDGMDARYQRTSGELDGFLDFEPNNRGQLTRLGPGDYRIRNILGDSESITITNGDGYSDNPSIALAATVASDHTWTGTNTYAAAILAEGGMVGAVEGDTAGTHTGPVTGDVTGNVTGNLTGNSTGTHTGSLDTRGGTVEMAAGQIDLSWLSAEIIAAIVNAGLPVGSVVAFAGTLEEVPDNWSVCDGSGGAPDLRDRFIIGAGPVNAADTAGGNFTHSHTITVESGGSHTHTGSAESHVLTIAELPGHRHYEFYNTTSGYGSLRGSPDETPNQEGTGGSSGASYDIGGTAQPSEANCGQSSTTGGGLGHAHTLAIDLGGTHDHSATSDVQSNTPPFYALVYIMKKA